MQNFEFWQFFAGLGFFLYGMGQLEHVLKNLSGRRIKLFLQRSTQSLSKAILGGAVVTGFIQSSSVVSLIVLAFVESGIIPFRNALGVILGANVGTTVTGWLVASVGFKLDILNFALPVIAITANGMFFLKKRKNIFHLCSIFFALGILFLGLDFMKVGAAHIVEDVDLGYFSDYGVLFFLLVGFVLTTIIQSSSATIAITLTAIHVGALGLPSAAAVVIGAEVGTTIKILLWGMTGTHGKKRVAWGNFIFNIFTLIIALLLLDFLLNVIVNILGVEDPLLSLVFFQSSINVIAVCLFFPFLTPFSNWLEKIIPNKRVLNSDNQAHFMPLLAVDNIRKEVILQIKRVQIFNKNILCRSGNSQEGLLDNIKSFARQSIDMDLQYREIKQQEGNILTHYANTRELNINKQDKHALMQYIQAVRLCSYAAKSIKDVEHNILEMDASVNAVFVEQRLIIEKEWREFDVNLDDLSLQLVHESITDAVMDAYIDTERMLYEQHVSNIINQMKKDALSEIEASTLMNVQREILSSKKSMLRAFAFMGAERLDD